MSDPAQVSVLESRAQLEARLHRAEDLLRYAAHAIHDRACKAMRIVEGSDEVEAIDGIFAVAGELYGELGEDHGTYSDGRQVWTEVEVVCGVYIEHVWRPDPDTEEPVGWEEGLTPANSDGQGLICEVSTDPETQTIHTNLVVRSAVFEEPVGAQ